METKTKTYKNVELNGFRTREIIDAVIECKNDGMSASQIAELIGINNYRPLVYIILRLKQAGYISDEPKNKEKPTKKEVKKPKEAKNTYDNYFGKRKEKARDLISKAILQTKTENSNILTLPADKWIMEKNILNKKNGYKFTAVERDKKTYMAMINNLLSDKQLFDSINAPLNKTVKEVIVNDNEDTYSSAILDYCGFIDSFYEEINDIMKRKLVRKDGFIAITLAENDRALNNPLQLNNNSNTLIRNCYAGEQATGANVTNELINILVFNNTGYRIVKKFHYKDKVTKMRLFIIQRIE